MRLASSVVEAIGGGRSVRRGWCAALATLMSVLFSAGASSAQPAPPTGLEATVAGNLLTLMWQAPAGAVNGYLIEAGTASGLTNIASVPVPAVPTSISTAVPNGRYFIRVRAVASGVTSAPSNEVAVSVGCTGPPAAPLGFAVTQGADGNPVHFSWAPPAVPVTGYRLEAGSGSGLANLATVNLAGSATVFDVQAPPGTFHVRLRALNGCGASAPSAEVIVTVGDDCIAPSPPQGLAGSVSGQTVSITWSPPPTGTAPFSYTLFAGSSSGASNLAVVPMGTATSIQAAVPGGTYFVRVVATNRCAVSPASNEVTFAIGTTLPPMVGTWDGQVFNHPGSFGRGPLTSFVLRIDAQPPNGNQRLGRWQDNLGCTNSNVFGYAAPSTLLTISVESLSCTDGDFWLRVMSVSGNVLQGTCRGGPCTFRMTKR